MGGYGSSRWGSHAKKATVEDCLCLNATAFVKRNNVAPGIKAQGSWGWTFSDGRRATIGYEVAASEIETASVRLTYAANGTPMDYRVRLVTTRPNFGGVRWWFICPRTDAKTSKLYLGPDGTFASREGHGLAYRSQQETSPLIRMARFLRRQGIDADFPLEDF